MNSSIGIAISVWYRAVPREPSSSERRAIVVSSGASIDVHEVERAERRPLGLDSAPSCSTSRLTSRMRGGLFLTVWASLPV